MQEAFCEVEMVFVVERKDKNHHRDIWTNKQKSKRSLDGTKKSVRISGNKNSHPNRCTTSPMASSDRVT